MVSLKADALSCYYLTDVIPSDLVSLDKERFRETGCPSDRLYVLELLCGCVVEWVHTSAALENPKISHIKEIIKRK